MNETITIGITGENINEKIEEIKQLDTKLAYMSKGRMMAYILDAFYEETLKTSSKALQEEFSSTGAKLQVPCKDSFRLNSDLLRPIHAGVGVT